MKTYIPIDAVEQQLLPTLVKWAAILIILFGGEPDIIDAIVGFIS